MAKKAAAKPGKDKKGGKDKKDKKSKPVKEAPTEVVPEPVEPPKIEEPKVEEILPKKLEVPEPCIFNCAQAEITYRPNSYPGLLNRPKTMAVVGSKTGSYDNLCKLLHAGFRCADRVLLMVPWGNYVLFRWNNVSEENYFVYDGCTCNINQFRYYDLTCGTAGLLFHEEMHKVVNYIIMSRQRREELKSLKRCIVDNACKELRGKEQFEEFTAKSLQDKLESEVTAKSSQDKLESEVTAKTSQDKLESEVTPVSLKDNLESENQV